METYNLTYDLICIRANGEWYGNDEGFHDTRY